MVCQEVFYTFIHTLRTSFFIYCEEEDGFSYLFNRQKFMFFDTGRQLGLKSRKDYVEIFTKLINFLIYIFFFVLKHQMTNFD